MTTTLRVHKAIGYGISDIQVDNGTVVDRRFDPNGYLCDKTSNKDEKYHLQEFFDHLCESDSDKWMVEMYSMDSFNALLDDCIHFTTIENKGVLVVCPPNKSHIWTRDDNVIDYCEEMCLCQSKPHCDLLRHGIPSYRYLMDQRSGRKLPTTIALEFISMLQKCKSATSDIEKYKLEPILADLVSDLKFDTIELAEANIVPLVPDIVVELCKFLHLFKDKATILSLRPMMLSYWS